MGMSRLSFGGTALASQIETMRYGVQVRGECLVTYDEVCALCADVPPPINYWEAVAKIAINECWSFTFFPDRKVRFARLQS
jgi:hypothetical protein